MSMGANNKRAMQGFQLMSEFLERNAVTSAVSDLAVTRESLRDAATRMETLAQRRQRASSDAQVDTQLLRELRRSVEQLYLAPLRILVRAGLAPAVGLGDVVRVPAIRDVVSQVAVARGVAEVAQKHAAAFTRSGLSPHFAEQLNALADEIQRVQARRGQHQAELAGAVSGLKAEGKRGRSVVALLDRLVRPALSSNPALLREWESVRRRAVWLSRGREIESAGEPPADAAVAKAA